MTQPALPDEAAAFLREAVGDHWSVEPLPGDASVRRYFRIRLPDGSTPKGYHRDDFEPVWKRYCPLPPQKDATTRQEI